MQFSVPIHRDLLTGQLLPITRIHSVPRPLVIRLNEDDERPLMAKSFAKGVWVLVRGLI